MAFKKAPKKTTKKTSSKVQPVEKMADEPAEKPAKAKPQTRNAGVDLTEMSDFILTSTSYINGKLIKASHRARVTIQLPTWIKKIDKKTGEEIIIPQPVSPVRPGLFRAEEGPGKQKQSHIPPQPRAARPAHEFE